MSKNAHSNLRPQNTISSHIKSSTILHDGGGTTKVFTFINAYTTLRLHVNHSLLHLRVLHMKSKHVTLTFPLNCTVKERRGQTSAYVPIFHPFSHLCTCKWSMDFCLFCIVPFIFPHHRIYCMVVRMCTGLWFLLSKHVNWFCRMVHHCKLRTQLLTYAYVLHAYFRHLQVGTFVSYATRTKYTCTVLLYTLWNQRTCILSCYRTIFFFYYYHIHRWLNEHAPLDPLLNSYIL